MLHLHEQHVSRVKCHKKSQIILQKPELTKRESVRIRGFE